MISSFCSGGDCVDVSFRTSSFSYGHGECVEVGASGDTVLVRDTKRLGAGPVFAFTASEWRAFVAGVKTGELR